MALRLALVEEALISGHFSHVTRPPTLAGVALMSHVLSLRRDGHVLLRWSDYVSAAASHDRQLLGSEGLVDAETSLLHTAVRLMTRRCTELPIAYCKLNSRLQPVIKKAQRYDYLPLFFNTLEELRENSDEKLFFSSKYNPNHVLHRRSQTPIATFVNVRKI